MQPNKAKPPWATEGSDGDAERDEDEEVARGTAAARLPTPPPQVEEDAWDGSSGQGERERGGQPRSGVGSGGWEAFDITAHDDGFGKSSR